MYVSSPMLHWSAFPGAYFSGLSDVLECTGGLQMARKVVLVLKLSKENRLPFRHNGTSCAPKEPSMISKPHYKAKQAI